VGAYGLAQLEAEFRREEDCLRAVWEARYGLPHPRAHCPSCARERRFYAVGGRRAHACETCRHQLYPTAGTVLQATRLPLLSWFTAVVMVRQGRSARDIHRRAGGSYNAIRRARTTIRDALMGAVAYGVDAAATLGSDATPAAYDRDDFERDLRSLLVRRP
jgi:transposase-like protein